MKVEPFDEKL